MFCYLKELYGVTLKPRRFTGWFIPDVKSEMFDADGFKHVFSTPTILPVKANAARRLDEFVRAIELRRY